MNKYPERLYRVMFDGQLTLYFHLHAKSIKDETRKPYGIISMTSPFNGQEWTLKDYEAEVKAILSGEKKVCSYSTYSLDEIDRLLSNSDIDYWTDDLDKAIELSKERYKKYHPTGKAYDVVRYWDDCDRTVLNKEPLTYQEAKELYKQEHRPARYGSLYSWAIEIHE